LAAPLFYGPSMTAKIFIATPTAGGVVKTPYAVSVAGLVADLERRGIETAIGVEDGADIETQRDRLVHEFLRTPATHLLFVDSDMTFARGLAFTLLQFDKPIVGTAYTARRLDFERVASGIGLGLSFDTAVARAYDFNVKTDAPVDSGAELVSVAGFGFGFVLIRRDCFDIMQRRCKLVRYRNPFIDAEVLGFFRRIPIDGQIPLSEDYSFCRRWAVECREPLWLYTRAHIRHVGEFRYGVTLSDPAKPQAGAQDERAPHLPVAKPP
jgi:hypothetical protein